MPHARAMFCALLLASPAMAQDDRTPITGVVETWMRFVQDGEHHGYTHEKISPSAAVRAYRYEYLYEGDLDVTTPSDSPGEHQVVHWNWHLTAQLTEDFEPYRLEMSSNVGGAQWKLDVRTVEDKRVIEVTMPQTAEHPQGEIVRREFAIDQPVAVAGPLLFFHLRHTRCLARPEENVPYRMLGAGAVEVPVKMRVEAPAMKRYLNQDQPSYVTPVTVEGAPGDWLLPAHSKVFVDKYGRVVEAVGREESMSYVICAGATEARGDEFALSARGRRDPFSKYGAMTPIAIVKSKPASRTADDGYFIPQDRVVEELVKAGKMIDDLAAAVRTGDHPRAETTYQRFLRQYVALRPKLAGDPVRLNQADGYKAKAEQLFGGAERLVMRARTLFLGIEDHYNALNDKGVEENLKQIRELRGRREFFRDERDDEMARIIAAAERKLAQTKVRIELRSKVLVLTGTVCESHAVRDEARVEIAPFGGRIELTNPVKLAHNVAFAVINDEPYKEGEVVRDQGVVIEKIAPHGIRVIYKGEVREVGLKKR